MQDDPSKKRLGRGLAALIGEMDQPLAVATPQSKPALSASDRLVAIESVTPNRANPRLDFDDEELEELARSIKAHGVVQPILVRPAGSSNHEWEIIAGERRWRAAQRAELHEVPIVIREVNDRQSLELALIENVQRSNLNAIEEAKGYSQLMEEHGYTQQELAKEIGKSRSHIANVLRLMKLPQKVQDMVTSGDLSSGHARALIGHDDCEPLADKIVSDGLSVREAERLAAGQDGANKIVWERGRRDKQRRSADTLALEDRLTQYLGLKTAIKEGRGETGRVSISYRDLDQLDGLVQRLLK
ncbi:MAG: ParB/RepB/Spo0J family partition protein [Ahrensia sp.]|nr:ParB/RepB/Spo0J family partition protein [Ahrensia sp.]